MNNVFFFTSDVSDVKNVETNLIWTMSFLSDVSDVKSVETSNLYD